VDRVWLLIAARRPGIDSQSWEPPAVLLSGPLAVWGECPTSASPFPAPRPPSWGPRNPAQCTVPRSRGALVKNLLFFSPPEPLGQVNSL
jgi:hypothetical protein